ncbi:MAG: Periplasmic copper-binding protein (NosD) [Candidatus Argoarchaeum ethanivorans]|uniref:Periplasmic copper-binding protein (NosD) n=1 Tax=Candidatus Argoarchaeum ethanivorans TaxID=2608793 RepID=A0A812A025_9EURY|nr:MAG: Periplasmic copper-binding protein (NosD) [Candidatus Argoarchaeum ethanivorans]
MKKKNKSKIGIAALLFVPLISISLFAGCASAATIYVPTDYSTIQEAIDAASPGDTVFVWNGTYYDGDGVKIEKDRITLQGEDVNTTTIHGKWTADGVVYVSGKYVNVGGFTVTGSSSSGSGIYLYYGSCNCRLSRNNASNNYLGIQVNAALAVPGLSSSDNNTLTGNSANNNTYGIYLYSSSDNNTLTGNSANNNTYGIYLYSSSNNNLAGNSANNNYDGIRLSSSCNNNLAGNSANNNYDGIRLSSSCNNNLTGNIANNNNYGIGLRSTSMKNNITENTVSNNPNDGIYLDWSGENEIWHNNFINNNKQAHNYHGFNNWDKGPAVGGNYWSDHACHGNPSNGTEPYANIYTDTEAVDNYPFENPDGWYLAGDLNRDGKIDYEDAAIVLSLAVKGKYSTAADVSGDGRVTSLDALMILQAGYGATTM